MESFQIKGDNGLIRIELDEVFGFPNQTSHFGGYECRADIEIKIPNYHVKGDFYTSTGEIFRFFEELNKCQKEIKGEAKYLTLEGNLELKVKFDNSGHAEINGRFQQSMGVENILHFEINSDQSFLKYTVDELKVFVNKYGDNKGIIRQSSRIEKEENKKPIWKFWDRKEE